MSMRGNLPGPENYASAIGFRMSPSSALKGEANLPLQRPYLSHRTLILSAFATKVPLRYRDSLRLCCRMVSQEDNFNSLI